MKNTNNLKILSIPLHTSWNKTVGSNVIFKLEDSNAEYDNPKQKKNFAPIHLEVDGKWLKSFDSDKLYKLTFYLVSSELPIEIYTLDKSEYFYIQLLPKNTNYNLEFFESSKRGHKFKIPDFKPNQVYAILSTNSLSFSSLEFPKLHNGMFVSLNNGIMGQVIHQFPSGRVHLLTDSPNIEISTGFWEPSEISHILSFRNFECCDLLCIVEPYINMFELVNTIIYNPSITYIRIRKDLISNYPNTIRSISDILNNPTDFKNLWIKKENVLTDIEISANGILWIPAGNIVKTKI